MKLTSFASLTLVCVAATASVAVLALRPPAAAGADAPLTDFSAMRAAVDVAAIAQRPHPVSSADHARVRDYVVRRLRELGVEPRLQETTGVFARDGVAGRVSNIVARLKGSASTRAILLATHYDSVPSGPGAGDDASGVAVLLETLRALRDGPALANDVIFLITDGEEEGLLGAAAFTAEHPWAKDVGLVLNFDARGDSGPAMMFETTPGNAAMIDLLRASVRAPRASSLTYAVYQRMPNDTDLTVFRAAGLPGLNFAFIGNVEAYHTRLDTPAHLSAATLQQQGEYALSITRAAGNKRLPLNSRSDATYFNVAGSLSVAYPADWVLPLTGVAVLLVLAIVTLAVRIERLSLGSLALAASALPIATAATTGLACFLLAGARWVHRAIVPGGAVSMSEWYASAIVALAMTVALTVITVLRARVAAVAIEVAALIWWAILAALAASLLPGANYLFLWPTICLALAAGVGLKSAAGVTPGIAMQLASLLLILFAVLLVAPVGHSLHVAFPLNTPGTIVLAAFVSIALGLVAEPLHRTVAAFGWGAVGAALAATIVLFAGGAAFTRYSAEHPQPVNLLYLFDADTAQAYWASRESTASAWTAQVLTPSPERSTLPAFLSPGSGEFLYHAAAAAVLPAPVVGVESDVVENDRRRVTLRIRAGSDAWQLRVRVAGAVVNSASINGRPVVAPPRSARESNEEWSLRYFNPELEGVRLVIEVPQQQPFSLRATAYLLGLPASGAVSPPPRPADAMPNHEGDLTLISHAVQFAAAPRAD
jgi:hypothetical protein